MNSKSRREHQSIATWANIAWVGGVVLFVSAIAWWYGRSNYPEASTPKSLHMIRALYTACSSRNFDRLATVEKLVIEAGEQGELTDEERASFAEIIATARDASWEQAADASYRFAQDQVR
jgi:ribosome biogenesis protein Tsr3